MQRQEDSVGRSTPPIAELLTRVRSFWPDSVNQESWYLVAACTLTSCHRPNDIGEIYKHLAQTTHTSSERQDLLSNRLKDALMKLWTIVGIPPVISSVGVLVEAEKELGRPTEPPTPSETHYQSLDISQATEDRGYAFMLDIYKHNLQPIMNTWGQHQPDFEWLEKRVIYGLFLADHRILSPFDTELVILCGMMCQGLRNPAFWHMRGLRRLGASKEDAEAVVRCIRMIAEWAGRSTEGWVTVDDVEAEV